jgi:hypothetical protein
MIKDLVDSLYYMFTGHQVDESVPVSYKEKVQGVLAWIGIIAFSIFILSIAGR